MYLFVLLKLCVKLHKIKRNQNTNSNKTCDIKVFGVPMCRESGGLCEKLILHFEKEKIYILYAMSSPPNVNKVIQLQN